MGHGDDPSSLDDLDENHPENQPSEIATNDPSVDPDTLLPVRQGRPNVPQPAPGPRAPHRPQRLSEASPSGQSHPDPLLKALRQLVQSRDNADDDWNSQKGPSRGVRWKTGAYPTPPTWKYEAGDVRAFPKFEKKIRIWEKQMAPFASKADQALILYGSLSGEPEQELEFLDIESIYTPDGIELILDTLRKPLEQKLVYQKRRFISEFENMRRYPTETLRAFINRFRRSLRSLKTVGINMDLAYDPEALGSRLLDRSGLSHESQRLLLVGTQQSLNFDLLAEAMVLQWPDFRGPPPVSGGRDSKGSGKGDSKSSRPPSRHPSSSSSGSTSASSYRQNPSRKQVYVTEAQSAAEDDQLDPINEEDEGEEQQTDEAEGNESDELLEDQEENIDMSEIAEVLTLTAKKLSGITLGRKFSTTKPKPAGKRSNMTPEEAKKVTHCSACGALGHWHEDAECPMNKGTSKGKSKSSSNKPGEKKPFGNKMHSVGIIHHEHGSLEITDNPTEYGSMFRVNMVNLDASPISNDTMAAFAVNEVKFLGPEGYKGFIVLDTGCQRTCCGERWYRAHSQFLSNFNLKPSEFEMHESFKFGKGTPSISTSKVYFPSSVQGIPLLLAASVLKEDIPFLASNSLITELGGVLDLDEDMIHFKRLGVSTKIHRMGGHLTMNICEFLTSSPSNWTAWDIYAEPSLWNPPHPEFILSPQAISLTTPPETVTEHALATTSMALSMAPNGHDPEAVCQEADNPDDDGYQLRHVDKGHSSVLPATRLEPPDESSKVSSRSMQTSRQCTRKVCNMPPVQQPLEMERTHQSM